MEKFSKMKKIAAVVERLLNVFRIIFIVSGIVAAACVVAFAVTWFTGNTALSEYFMSLDTNTLQLDSVRLALDQVEVSDDYLLGFLASAACAVGSLIGLSLYMIRQLRKVFKPMSVGQPFDTQVSKAIRNMAGGVLIGGSLMQLLHMLTQVLQYKMFSMDTFFLNSHISACKLDLTFETHYLVWAGLLLLLSYVFRYGEELQKQADETL